MSVGHSIYLTKTIQEAIESGSLDENVKYSIALSVLTKLGAGAVTTNPVTIASGLYDVGLISYSAYAAPAVIFPGPELAASSSALSSVKEFAKSAAAGASAAFATGGILHSFTETDSQSLTNRLRKIAFSGACGGLTGACVSVVATNPIAISAAAVSGYVAGEWLYERFEDEDEHGFLPSFLTQ
jgi:hypothetical protein